MCEPMTEATATDRKAHTRTARDPATAPEQLQACAGLGETIDRLLARHPNASAQLLTQLAVARNPAAPSGVLDTLTKDAHRLVALQAEATHRLKAAQDCG
jgi:hypothetical protein